MKSILAKQDNGTIQLTITIPQEDITKVRELVVGAMSRQTNLPGFRKGKAPKKMVEEQINPDIVREEILKQLLPKLYVEAVEEHKLRPIVSPQIHVSKVEEGKDWEFVATTCEMPDVKLGNYKDKVKSLTAKSKIVVPGKEKQEVKFDDVVKEVVDSCEVTIPGLLVNQEVERMLSHLLDDIKRLGLNLDQYLASTNRSAEALREEYTKKAESDIKFEFILQKIAEEEKITVEEKEIEEAIQKAKGEEEKKNLEANRYLLATILRQQKTLDFLRNL